MSRLAGQVWDLYKNNSLVQDAAETVIGAGIGAAGQALFTDMTPEEIGQSALIGSALAMAARPVGAVAGQALGRGLDRVNPKLLDGVDQFIPITPKGKEAALRGAKDMGMDEKVIKGMDEYLTAKRNQNAIKPDGSERGTAETVLGYYGRNRADNIAQFGFAAISPLIYGGEADEPAPATLPM